MAIKVFNDLPIDVQHAILSASGLTASDYLGQPFALKKVQGWSGVWAVPTLCYDFAENNFCVTTVNLKACGALDVGPAQATMYEKIDPSADAWIIIDGRHNDVDNQVFHCI